MRTHWTPAAYLVTKTDGATIRIITKGRDRWALDCLRLAGPKGCTPIDHPGPRWSAYVFKLRNAGVEIETITEAHKGDFPGHHARYVLTSTVTPDHAAMAQGCAA